MKAAFLSQVPSLPHRLKNFENGVFTLKIYQMISVHDILPDEFENTTITRLSEKSFVLFIQYPQDLSRLRCSLSRFATQTTAASRPNILYPEIHEVDLWQV